MDSPATPASCPGNRVLPDWLAWLETLSPREIDLGLERVTTVLERLALPRPSRVLHVAGTNGKGSTVAMLEALYRMDGHRRVACYTSPHVERYNERMRIDGAQVSDAQVLDAFETVEAARDGIPLTYFEFGTLAAFVAFARADADVWILEIGLGGRLDAVNALDPDGAVITTISLDHCDWLGPDTESIAREKAGVMRPGIPVVFAGTEAPNAIAATAAAVGATLILRERDYIVEVRGTRWQVDGPCMQIGGLRPPALAGRFQLDNAAGALALYTALEPSAPADAGAINAAFASLTLPGRLQRIDNGRSWLLDVAHNPGAAAVLAEELSSLTGEGRTIAVLGVLADKDVDGIIGPLAPHIDTWIAVAPRAQRALPARELAARIVSVSGKPCRIEPGIPRALRTAAGLATAEDLLLVSGSFYVVGPALTWLTHCDILAAR